MRKTILLFLAACLLFEGRSVAQGRVRGNVKGLLVDSAGKQNMSDATVSVTPLSDSTDEQFTVTDKNGAFNIRGLSAGTYRLIITFSGYYHITRTFTVNAGNTNIDYGTFYMRRATNELPDVLIQSPPMTIRKDTVEYSADKFPTKPNAFVEDQLKKLPGMEVDASGNITHAGEAITRVLVNGQRFFSDDPKLATRNIPPDVVEKYQVFDDLDDQSKFTGIDDGNRVKTLNIITKKDKRVGYFGRAIAGVGTNQTYDESFNFHRFNNEQQISALGEADDINKQNFTVQDILGSSGGRKGSGGGPAAATNQSSPGITTVWAGGVNYHDFWTPDFEINGSYFYNFTHVAAQSDAIDTRLLNPTTDSTNIDTATSAAISRTTNQRIYLNMQDKIDSNNTFVFRPNVTFQTTSPNGSSSGVTVDNNDSLISRTSGYTSSTNTGFNINGSNFTFRHKFKHPFQTLTLDLTGTVNVNNGSGYYYSQNNFYRLDSTQTINQFYNDSLHSYSISPTLNYTQAVSKHSYVLVSYNFGYNKSTTVNDTYDYVDTLHNYSVFDSLFSNSYKFTSTSNRLSLIYRITSSKMNLNLGTGVQYMDFNSLNTTKDIPVTHGYWNITPTAQFNYSFDNNKRLRIYYMGRTGNPSASQLQPLVTTSDDINFLVGNPNLAPQFTHSLRALYQSYSPVTGHFLFATLNASATVHDIQNETINTLKGGDTTKYVNLNGTYNASGYFNYGFALPHPKSNLNFVTDLSYSQSQNLADTSRTAATETFIHDWTRNYGVTEKIIWTTTIRKNFDMNFNSASSWSFGRSSLNTIANLNTFTQTFNAEVTAYTNSGWLVAGNLTYTIENTNTPGFNENAPLFTPSIAKEMFKKKNGELRLTLFDLFHENTAVSKSISGLNESVSRNEVLPQYFMLTFTYNLNNFKGSQHGRMQGPGQGGFRRGGFGGGNGGGGYRGGGGNRGGGDL